MAAAAINATAMIFSLNWTEIWECGTTVTVTTTQEMCLGNLADT